jgi:hypothetical protein
MWLFLRICYLIEIQKNIEKLDIYFVFMKPTNITLKCAEKINLSFGIWKILYGREL